VVLEQRAGHLPGQFRLAIGLTRRLTRVRRRADVDIHPAAAVEGQALRTMTLLIGQRGNHLGGPRRLQLPLLHRVADDPRVLTQIEVAGPERDPGAALCRELLLNLELPVAIGIAQPDDRAWRALRVPDGDKQVTVRGNGHVAADAEIVGGDQRAEAGRQRNAAVVRVARRRSCSILWLSEKHEGDACREQCNGAG
jgi:hypothetical protein